MKYSSQHFVRVTVDLFPSKIVTHVISLVRNENIF